MNQSVLPSSDNEEHMLGHGFYNKHSHAQGEANTYGLPLIIEAINQIDLGQIGTEFRIADYGSAQGQNSLLPMKTAIAQVKALATKAGRTESQSQLHTRICRPTIGRRCFKQSYLHLTAISRVRATCFALQAALPSTARFFLRTTSRLATRPSPNIG